MDYLYVTLNYATVNISGGAHQGFVVGVVLRA